MRTAVHTFKDLVVWRRAFRLCVEAYHATKTFPWTERLGLTAELRKTARSLPNNIAEGHRRSSTSDYLRFLDYASASGAELETQLLLARELGYLEESASSALLLQLAEVDRMLCALIRALRARRHGG